MIGIIDYDAGNIHSVLNALEALGVNAKLVDSGDCFKDFSGLIIPGVGSFGAAMQSLNDKGITAKIKDAAKHMPILGICLGFQVLFEQSEESPRVAGLSLLKGKVVKLNPKPTVKKPVDIHALSDTYIDSGHCPLPHIGWSSVQDIKNNAIGKNPFYYFCHSYCVEVVPSTQTVAEYGKFKYTASVESGNIYGAQFHPEKSGADGLSYLKKFAAVCKEAV